MELLGGKLVLLEDPVIPRGLRLYFFLLWTADEAVYAKELGEMRGLIEAWRGLGWPRMFMRVLYCG